MKKVSCMISFLLVGALFRYGSTSPRDGLTTGRTCSCQDDPYLCDQRGDQRAFCETTSGSEIISLRYIHPDGERRCVLSRQVLCTEFNITCYDDRSDLSYTTLCAPWDFNATTHYHCLDGMTSIRRSNVCDKDMCNDCPEDNEYGNGIGFKCRKNNMDCVLPQKLVIDNIPDCDKGEDICFSNNRMLKSCFQCKNSNIIIPRKSVCDGVIDCPDLTDECLCDNRPAICKNVVETFDKAKAKCSHGEIMCGNNMCIQRNRVCDGEVNCPDQFDENSVYCAGTAPCRPEDDRTCRCPLSRDNPCTAQLQRPGEFCNINVLSESPSIFCEMGDSENRTIGYKCDGNIDCEVSKIDETNCTERFLCDTQDHLISIPMHQVCNGVLDCLNGEDERICPDRFNCMVDRIINGASVSLVSISSNKVCDFVMDCNNQSDERNCTDERFYCESGQPLFIQAKQINDGRRDCIDGSDECYLNRNKNSSNPLFFHSRYELLGNKVLFVLVWIMAVLALVGNGVVIFHEIRILRRMQFEVKAFASLRTNHILVLNLAISDLLMGIYLVSLGIAYERLRGSYCSSELLWRSSRTCSWMGITVMISCETSVLTMVLLTIFRLYAILKPFNATSHPKLWLVFLLTATAWALSVIVAILPITNVYRKRTPDEAWIDDNPFTLSTTVKLDSAKRYLQRILIYSPPALSTPTILRELAEKISLAKTWDELIIVHSQLHRENDLNVIGRFGYYNIHSVCIANFFPNKDDPHLLLSISVVSLNFLAFVFIASVYIAIYVITFKNKATTTDESEAGRMKWKIFRLIFTNFLSWVLICILALCKLNEVSISSEVYSAVAIVLLPINSALNPILYSNAISKLSGFIKCLRRKQKPRINSIDLTLGTTNKSIDVLS